MAYLTFEEFKEINIGQKVEEEEFNKFLPLASSVLDNLTNNFYIFNELDRDIEYRANRFKQALVAQIQYFKETGAISHYGLNKTPQSFSAGRTSVSMGSRQSTKTSEISLIANEVYLYLEGTGLLYRGVQ